LHGRGRPVASEAVAGNNDWKGSKR
jgi:hypothetical protein